jgi:hypothetical protein
MMIDLLGTLRQVRDLTRTILHPHVEDVCSVHYCSYQLHYSVARIYCMHLALEATLRQT